jgi:hypothetical protein
MDQSDHGTDEDEGGDQGLAQRMDEQVFHDFNLR